MVADVTALEGELSKWQTLIAGMTAMAAAWWSVSAIHLQIAQTDRSETDRRESRRAAARATLPLALSAISHYAEDCSRILHQLVNNCIHGSLPTSVLVASFPAPPIEAISSLKEMTELAKPSERRTIAALLCKIQIQWSRVSSLANERRRASSIVADLNLKSFIIDTAEIQARADAIFDFARLKSDTIPTEEVSRQQVGRAVRTPRSIWFPRG